MNILESFDKHAFLALSEKDQIAVVWRLTRQLIDIKVDFSPAQEMNLLLFARTANPRHFLALWIKTTDELGGTNHVNYDISTLKKLHKLFVHDVLNLYNGPEGLADVLPFEFNDHGRLCQTVQRIKTDKVSYGSYFIADEDKDLLP